jgi:hypothetical protein
MLSMTVLGIEDESGGVEGIADLAAKLGKRAPQTTSTDGSSWLGHDLEIHVLRHPPDNLVRAGERSAATKNERERRHVQGGDSSYGTDNLKVLLDETDTRQSEVSLDLAKLTFTLIVQAAAPRLDI